MDKLRTCANRNVSVPSHERISDCLDLYKSWNVLHVLLDDRSSGPAGDAVMGGVPVGEDMGYGPARILDEQEVAEISTDLQDIPTNDFESRFDIGKMEEVYSFDIEHAEEEWLNTSELFEQMKKFYASAAEQSCGMLLFLV